MWIDFFYPTPDKHELLFIFWPIKWNWLISNHTPDGDLPARYCAAAQWLENIEINDLDARSVGQFLRRRKQTWVFFKQAGVSGRPEQRRKKWIKQEVAASVKWMLVLLSFFFSVVVSISLMRW